MTDYPSPNSFSTSPYGNPYDNPYGNPNGSAAYPLNNQTPVQPPLEVSEPFNGKNSLYRTQCNSDTGSFSALLFIFGIGVAIVVIYNGIKNDDSTSLLFALIPLLFAVIGIIFGICTNLYVTISISPTFGTIIINTKKMCFCLNKQVIIQINDIQQIIVERDPFKTVQQGKVRYRVFGVTFKLVDGREVVGFTKIMDKHGEGKGVFQFLRNSLPTRIAYSGDLTN